jgi:hypothetical protein
MVKSFSPELKSADGFTAVPTSFYDEPILTAAKPTAPSEGDLQAVRKTDDSFAL